MSVVQSKRGEGQLLVLSKANELSVYTIKICSNEKNFPKHYRWCIEVHYRQYLFRPESSPRPIVVCVTADSLSALTRDVLKAIE